jgi:hypothetical protein
MIKRGLNKTLAEVGKIKTGMKGAEVTSKGGVKFQPPKKLDYFIITTTERGPDGNLIEDGTIMEKLGKEPRELKIRLPFDSIDKNFFTQYQAYSGGKKLCAGDGEIATRKGEITVKDEKLVVKGETLAQVICDPETCPILAAGKCKVSGILSCFLPESGDLGGVYKYRTHSWNGVSSILGALEYFSQQTGGILQGMPLKLVLVKKTTEDHGNVIYGTLVIDGEEIHGLRKLAIEERESRKMLGYDMAKVEAEAVASGILEDRDAPSEVEAEFYVEDEQAPPPKGTSADDVAKELEAQDSHPETAPVQASEVSGQEGKPVQEVKTGKTSTAGKGADFPATAPSVAPSSDLDIF